MVTLTTCRRRTGHHRPAGYRQGPEHPTRGWSFIARCRTCYFTRGRTCNFSRGRSHLLHRLESHPMHGIT